MRTPGGCVTAVEYRLDRNGHKRVAGWILDGVVEVPVYHAYRGTNRDLIDYAVCGQYLTGAGLFFVHLDKFARPCRRCWDTA